MMRNLSRCNKFISISMLVTILYGIIPTGIGNYTYTSDLLGLNACVNPSPPPLPVSLTRIVTPLCLGAWSGWLQHHPDRPLVTYLITGISQGFRIGFQHTSHTCNFQLPFCKRAPKYHLFKPPSGDIEEPPGWTTRVKQLSLHSYKQFGGNTKKALREMAADSRLISSTWTQRK